jgi:hypothetical protein
MASGISGAKITTRDRLQVRNQINTYFQMDTTNSSKLCLDRQRVITEVVAGGWI